MDSSHTASLSYTIGNVSTALAPEARPTDTKDDPSHINPVVYNKLLYRTM